MAAVPPVVSPVVPPLGQECGPFTTCRWWSCSACRCGKVAAQPPAPPCGGRGPVCLDAPDVVGAAPVKSDGPYDYFTATLLRPHTVVGGPVAHPGAPDVVGAFAPELKNPPPVLPKTVDGEEIRVEEAVGSIELKKLYMTATPLPSLGASAPAPSATCPPAPPVSFGPLYAAAAGGEWE